MSTLLIASRRESFLRSIGTGALWRVLATLASLAKHVLVAGAIGLSSSLDVFYMANALLVVLLHGWSNMLETLALPKLVALRQDEDAAGFDRLAGSLLVFSLLGSAAMAAIVFAAAGPLSHLAPGFEPERRALLEEALRWMAPVVLFYPPMRFMFSLYRATRRTSIAAQGELLMGAAILASVALFPHHPQVLLWSYGLGALVGFSYLAVRASAWVKLWGAPLTAEVHALLAGAPSLLVLLTLTYATQLTDRMFQSFLPPGSVGALSYAWALVQLMPGLLYLGSAFMTVFAERRQRGESGADVLDPLVSLAVLLGVPATGFLIVFGDGVIRLLLERGGFTGHDTVLTAQALAGYTPGLIALMLLGPMQQVFQVLGRNRVLMARVLAAMAANIALNAFLVMHLHWGVLGIALAFAVSQSIALALSFHFLHHQDIRLQWGRHAAFAGYIGVGTLLALYATSSWRLLGHPAWLVLPEAAGFALAMAGWALTAPGPEGALIRATAGRFRPRRQNPTATGGTAA